jgi:uncharacterized membrane protein required for colicin V production
MSTIDIVLLIVFILAIFWGFKKGLISTLMALIGLIGSFFMFARFAPKIQAGIVTQYNMTGDIFAGFIAYILIIIMVAVLVKLVSMLFNYIAYLLDLTMINRVLGGAFGFSCLFVVMMFFLYILAVVPPLDGIQEKLVANSVMIREIERVRIKLTIKYSDELPEGFRERRKGVIELPTAY